MTKFKVGDKVKRIAGFHNKMKTGDMGTVLEINAYGDVRIKEFDTANGFHSKLNLIKIQKDWDD